MLDTAEMSDTMAYQPPNRAAAGKPLLCVRTYTREDRSVVLALAERMHSESKYNAMQFDRDAVAAFLDQIDKRNIAGYVAAHRERGIVGFICMATMPYMFTQALLAHDLALYVVPEFRHTIAFAALVRAGEKWAKWRGADAVMLGVSAPHDVSKTVRAYEKLGYAQWGVCLRKEMKQ